MSVPAFSDISKSANDLLNKDFYHLSAGTIEVKSNTPNNVAFKVTGKSSHEKATSGAVSPPPNPTLLWRTAIAVSVKPQTGFLGCQWHCSYLFCPINADQWLTVHRLLTTIIHSIFKKDTTRRVQEIEKENNLLLMLVLSDTHPSTLLTVYRGTGLTLTQTWNTANALESKVELADSIAKGLKAEGVFSFLPANQARGAKLNLHFKQNIFHGRAFFDLLKGPVANVDAVVGHEGFLAGASAGFDVQKGALTGYSAALGFVGLGYTTSITATDNLNTFAASYYHKVNGQVEAGAKATWNSKTGNTVGLEVASKYRLDPVSFAKAKINDRGVAAVAYNVLLRPGVTLGLGGSFDTQKLDQATHKVGVSFTFEG
ncbi:putative Mitochondrial outer membrane protein porin [Seiridium cardinale]|uniref:Mitochondrial outer membrane protein porin n=1 Tax=Seiridium cardinale TaxID=138064 RepID=A0ABR2Y7Z8_9PEZI